MTRTDAQIAREWASVPGYEGYYEVSTLGEVRSLDRKITFSNGNTSYRKGRNLAQSDKGRGYLSVDLWRNNRPTPFSVHVLVLSAFVGPRPEGHVAMHLDDDPQNNTLTNLKWGTQSENVKTCMDKKRHPLTAKNECPAGHPFSEATLIPSQLKRGIRACLACSKAHGYIRRRPVLKPNFKQIADSYYDELTEVTP